MKMERTMWRMNYMVELEESKEVEELSFNAICRASKLFSIHLMVRVGRFEVSLLIYSRLTRNIY